MIINISQFKCDVCNELWLLRLHSTGRDYLYKIARFFVSAEFQRHINQHQEEKINGQSEASKTLRYL